MFTYRPEAPAIPWENSPSRRQLQIQQYFLCKHLLYCYYYQRVKGNIYGWNKSGFETSQNRHIRNAGDRAGASCRSRLCVWRVAWRESEGQGDYLQSLSGCKIEVCLCLCAALWICPPFCITDRSSIVCMYVCVYISAYVGVECMGVCMCRGVIGSSSWECCADGISEQLHRWKETLHAAETQPLAPSHTHTHTHIYLCIHAKSHSHTEIDHTLIQAQI